MKQIVAFLFLMGANLITAQEADFLPQIQANDTLPNSIIQKKTFFNSPYSGLIIPATFISYGALTQCIDGLHKIDHKTHQKVTEHFIGKIRADDYIQYVPAIAVYGLDLIGLKAKHNWKDRTFLMASSYLLSTASVQTIKRTANVIRPDASNSHSFPSGHTATAFVGAHLLFKEYKNTSPWIGIVGYAIAAGTGTMRILNRKHWVSDVVAGAGFGILSVEISYLLLPAFQKLTGNNDRQKSFVLAPVINKNNYGLGIACKF